VKKKFLPTYKPGDDALLFELFDIGEMEHVSDLVKASHDPAPKGYRNGLAESLRRFLLPPVENMIHRLHETGRGPGASEFEATDDFRACIENVARLLTINGDGPYSKEEAGQLAGELRSAWTGFIAHAAAYRMYCDLPRELETNKRKTGPMLDKREITVIAAKVRQNQIVERYAELKAAGTRGIRKMLAREFNLSPNTIKNTWGNRDREKYPG
jgi:hypothetical protein